MLNRIKLEPTSWGALMLAGLAGAVVGAVAAGIMTESLVWSLLMIVGIGALIPAFVAKNPQNYWLSLYVLSTMLDIKKTLADGNVVMGNLGVDYAAAVELVVPEIRLCDIPFAVLMLIWAVQLVRREATFHFPRITLVAATYLCWSAISAIAAVVPYLAILEWTRQARFVLVFLYVINNVGSKQILSLIIKLLLLMLLLQSSFTIARFVFGFQSITGDAFGRTDASHIQHLKITSELEGTGRRRSYGSVPSPRGTAAHLLLLLPFPIFLVTVTRSKIARWAYLSLFALGTLALILTFSRAAFLAYALGGATWMYLSYRLRLISSATFYWLITGTVAAAVVASPLIFSFLANRPENVEIRLNQFQSALRIITDNPILGVGLNNSATVQESYNVNASSLATHPAQASSKHMIHSQHLANIAETGIIGFALYMGFFLLVGRMAWKLFESPDKMTQAAAAGLLTGIISLFVHFCADPIYEHQAHTLLWMYPGLIYVLCRDHLRRTDAIVTEPAKSRR